MSLLGKDWYAEYIDYKDGYKAGYEAAMKEIEERKTGKWIDRAVCSNCSWYLKSRFGLAENVNFPYCPNCGAKMEVDE